MTELLKIIFIIAAFFVVAMALAFVVSIIECKCWERNKAEAMEMRRRLRIRKAMAASNYPVDAGFMQDEFQRRNMLYQQQMLNDQEMIRFTTECAHMASRDAYNAAASAMAAADQTMFMNCM